MSPIAGKVTCLVGPVGAHCQVDVCSLLTPGRGQSRSSIGAGSGWRWSFLAPHQYFLLIQHLNKLKVRIFAHRQNPGMSHSCQQIQGIER
jgi:hypothetical protein